MHISPEMTELGRRADHQKCAILGASSPGDIYALGCIANQIFFREPLFNEASGNAGENFNEAGSERKTTIYNQALFVDFVGQIIRGERSRPPLHWSMRNSVARTEMLEMLISCCAVYPNARPVIRQVKLTVGTTANNM
jgi:hypothetical protein